MSEKKIAAAIRFPQSEYEQVDNWRRRQPRVPPLATAVRVLVQEALKAADASPAKTSPATDLSKRPAVKDGLLGKAHTTA